MSEHPTPDQIMQVGLGFWASKTLLSAVEMELFTELARHPESGEALRDRLGLHPRSSRDFLDALVALGFLERRDGVYGNTPSTDLFLDKRKPSYIGGHLGDGQPPPVRLLGRSHRGAADRAAPERGEVGRDAVLRGAVCGSGPLEGVPRRDDGAQSRRQPGDREAIPLARAQDVRRRRDGPGRPRGADRARERSTSRASASTCPRWRRSSRSTSSTTGCRNGSGSPRGDFFADDLPQADVLVMGHILHDWSLDEKRMLIGKAHEALPDGGALIVYEAIIDDDRSKNAFGLLMSLNMLIETEGGFDYTAADCMGWMTDAGFTSTRAEHLVGPDSMVIGVK